MLFSHILMAPAQLSTAIGVIRVNHTHNSFGSRSYSVITLNTTILLSGNIKQHPKLLLHYKQLSPVKLSRLRPPTGRALNCWWNSLTLSWKTRPRRREIKYIPNPSTRALELIQSKPHIKHSFAPHIKITSSRICL